MDMGFDHAAWPLGQGQRADSGTAPVGLDWHGLRARFLAALAMRRALAADEAPADMVAGASFDSSAAQALAGFGAGSYGVNQRDSADGKAASDIDEEVADASTRGDRG